MGRPPKMSAKEGMHLHANALPDAFVAMAILRL
jgi:hypothetical protein